MALLEVKLFCMGTRDLYWLVAVMPPFLSARGGATGGFTNGLRAGLTRGGLPPLNEPGSFDLDEALLLVLVTVVLEAKPPRAHSGRPGFLLFSFDLDSVVSLICEEDCCVRFSSFSS